MIRLGKAGLRCSAEQSYLRREPPPLGTSAVLKRLLIPEQMGNECHLSEVLHRFHLHVRALQVFTIGDDAMVRHQYGVILRNQGL
jgi:hypothetical protein